MKMRSGTIRSVIGLVFIAMMAFFATSRPLQAKEKKRVAVVVRSGDDQVETKCVEFEEEQISGYEALRRSDLPVLAGFNAQGGAVCQIDGIGCPVDNCFCQCKGGQECIYWSYWQLIDEAWNYAQVGATANKVNDRDVEGWSWGPGSLADAIEPPIVTFEDICESGDVSSIEGLPIDDQGSIDWRQIALFGAVLGILVLVLVAGRVRRRGL